MATDHRVRDGMVENRLAEAAAREREAIFRFLLPELKHDINSPYSVVDSTFSNLLHTMDLLQLALGAANLSEDQVENLLRSDSDIHYMVENLPHLILAARERAHEVKATAQAMIRLMGESGTAAEGLEGSYSTALALLRGFLKHRVSVSSGSLPEGAFLCIKYLLQILVAVFIRAADGAESGAEMQVVWSRKGTELQCSIQCEGSFPDCGSSESMNMEVTQKLLAASGGALEVNEEKLCREYHILFPIKEGYV